MLTFLHPKVMNLVVVVHHGIFNIKHTLRLCVSA